MPNKPENVLYCSFCDNSQHMVRKLIAGPEVYICDDCVRLAVEIIVEDLPDQKDLALSLTRSKVEVVRNALLVDRTGKGSEASVVFTNNLLEILRKDLPGAPHLTNLVRVIDTALNEVIVKVFEDRLAWIEEQLKPVIGLPEEAEELTRRLKLLEQ